MSKAQNTQLHLNLLTSVAQKFIKFCYFIILFLVVSCGENNTEKKINEAKSEKETEQTEATDASTKTILCFGDSITAGYGLDDVTDAFPGVIQQKIDSLGLDYTVVNSGVSGETTAGGRGRIDWILNQKVDIFILELGANDGLRGVNLVETTMNLQAIIDAVKAKSPKTKIVLAGMQLPPNMGQEYTRDFKQIFMNVAEKNEIELIPFILEDVGGIAELNQKDGIHPTVEGHKLVANTVWKTLEPLLEK
ncbi:arylesterase [Winogradskyella undariae]|uniref:arylesterase n=1 Tax=Winogradskyella undariae TaxID=1285465 RepID=UPI00156B3F13|nr:arylesterase [Winogradskyella undariae]NRR93043.1 arylesterase [Winogradskyella undariae]